jgi:hypothetical protein
MGLERADANDGTTNGQGEPARGGNSHPQSCKRTRANGDCNAIEHIKGEPSLVHGRGNHAEQAFGMAAADDLRRNHRRSTAASHGDRARFKCSIDCEKLHCRSDK